MSESAEPNTVRRWPRWLLLVGLAVLVFLGLVAARSYHNRRQNQARLQALLGELDRDDPNWRLDEIELARADVPEAENGALCVTAASKLLPPDWPKNDFYESLAGLAPNERLSAGQAVRLNWELGAVRLALAEARKSADRPAGRFPRALPLNPLALDTEGVQHARQAVVLLNFDARRHSQAGDHKAALNSCRAALHVARSIGDEPLFVSQLVRTACVAIACSMAERALAQGEADPEALAALQRALEEEDRFPAMLVAVRGERAYSHAMCEAARNGTVSPHEVLGSPGGKGGLGERWRNWRAADNLAAEHPRVLTLMTQAVANARLPLHEQGAAERAWEAELHALPRESVARQLTSAVPKMGTALRRKHAQVRCLIALVAVERHRRARGAWPASLDQLAPGLLPAVPLDPFDGKPLRYRRLAEGAVVYSVGPDEKDDGGKLDRQNPSAAGTDVGFQLWDVAQRGRAPRPAPPAPPAPPGIPGPPGAPPGRVP